MLKPLTRIIRRVPRPTGGSLARTVVGGLGGAVLAGLGWKLGSDLYEGIKRRVKRPPPEPETDEP